MSARNGAVTLVAWSGGWMVLSACMAVWSLGRGQTGFALLHVGCALVQAFVFGYSLSVVMDR